MGVDDNFCGNVAKAQEPLILQVSTLGYLVQQISLSDLISS